MKIARAACVFLVLSLGLRTRAEDVRSACERAAEGLDQRRKERPAGLRLRASGRHGPHQVLRLIPELVDDVRSGGKTSTIRPGRALGLERGPAVFRVPGSNEVIKIVITAVHRGRRLGRLTPAELRAQGPYIEGLLKTPGGRARALAAIARGMKYYYPGFDPALELTVVHFRVRGR